MRRPVLALLLASLAASPLLAQDAADPSDAGTLAKGVDSTNAEGGSVSMGDLLKQGFEIKAAVPSGTTKLIIFMQKEKSAYACEFTNLANTRCGSII